MRRHALASASCCGKPYGGATTAGVRSSRTGSGFAGSYATTGFAIPRRWVRRRWRRFCRGWRRSARSRRRRQALSALLFLYKELLGQDLPWFKDLVRAKRPVRIPAVLSRAGRVGLAVRVSLGRSIRGPGLRRDPAAPRVSGYAGPGGQGRGVTSPLDRIESEGRTRYIAKYWRQE